MFNYSFVDFDPDAVGSKLDVAYKLFEILSNGRVGAKLDALLACYSRNYL